MMNYLLVEFFAVVISMSFILYQKLDGFKQ